MTDNFCALGIDPGPAPGFGLLHYEMRGAVPALADAEVYQCNTSAALSLFSYLLHVRAARGPVYCQTERFVAGPRSSKLKGTKASTTQGLIADLQLEAAAAGHRVQLMLRSAGAVKPWATDERLTAAGLAHLMIPGMTHSRDGLRHSLFTASKDAGVPDPLSRRSRPG